jgi:hypothetical protein
VIGSSQPSTEQTGKSSQGSGLVVEVLLAIPLVLHAHLAGEPE